MKRSLVIGLTISALPVLCGAGSYVPGVPQIDVPLGNRLPLFSVLPFAGLLMAIALFPLAADAWWESNLNKAKLSALFAVPLAGFLIFHFGWTGFQALAETFADYVALMALLGSLYAVCGGIFIEGGPVFDGRKKRLKTSLSNTVLLAAGAFLANLVGTMGASMILVRPLLRANAHRANAAHIPIFLIFIVANCGGLLTPLGDPPLFLGYLAGVPFTWTFGLLPAWILVNGTLLAVFFVWDFLALDREPSQVVPPTERGATQQSGRVPRRVLGLANVPLLAAIVATVFIAGKGLGTGGRRWPFGVAEMVLAGIALVSIGLTTSEARQKNRFTARPLVEVAVLFAGIFITMTPALAIMNARGSQLGLTKPAHYFWASGLLSSVLDNAPTYLAFTATAAGSEHIAIQGRYLAQLLDRGPASGSGEILAAISCGCVFMGALTYIGNGPNLMIRAIARESNVQMPGFLGYMAYSVTILIPLFVLATILLFSS